MLFALQQSYEALPLEQRATLLFGSLPASAGIPDEGRQLAAVMLRRLISNDFNEFFDKLNDEHKAQFKGEMLNLLQSEGNRNVRRKIVDLVAETSRNLMDDDGNNLWPEFLNMLFVLAKAPSNELKEASLLLFSAVPSVFGNQNSHYIDVIKQMLHESLTNQESYDVRFTGVKAAVNYLLLHEKDATVLKHMSDLLGPILNVSINIKLPRLCWAQL